MHGTHHLCIEHPSKYVFNSPRSDKIIDPTARFIENRVHKSKVGTYKAMGPDSIHNRFIKLGCVKMIECLTRIFNYSYSLGYVPKSWKLANIVPIRKPGRVPHTCKAYRPIALTSCLGKIMERVLTARITVHVHSYFPLHFTQAGFRPNHNTMELLHAVTEEASKLQLQG